MELYPLTFELDGMGQNYLWGGRKLVPLMPHWPADEPLAEIWVISDRPEDERVSIVSNGPLAGTSLRELVTTRTKELLGTVPTVNGKFPLLIKLLDAQQRLSLQVHPPATIAQRLGAEPKTESWLLLEGTNPDAHIIAGLKHPTTQTEFEAAARSGELEPLLHSQHVRPGDFMFLPSGRLHAIDAGCLILEIQQNSNTTYRVFDWNRVDPKTQQPRQLHLQEALQSIDFDDIQPSLTSTSESAQHQTLIEASECTVEQWQLNGLQEHSPDGSFEIITVLSGSPTLHWQANTVELTQFQSVLIPACLPEYHLTGTAHYVRTFIRTLVQ